MLLMQIFNIALENPLKVAGKIYNVGGGLNNSISVWKELGPILEGLFDRDLAPELADWRPGDQRFFVADCGLAERELGWKPKISVQEGIEKLYNWINENRSLLSTYSVQVI